MAISGNNQTLSVTIGANMDPSGVLSAVKQMQGAFSGLKLPGDIGADLEKSFSKATDLLKKYQTQLSKGINTKTDAKNITKTGSQINEVLDEIVTHINSINGQQIFLKADVSGLNTLKANIEDARTAWKNAIQEFRKGSDIETVLNEIAEKTTRSGLTQGSISSAKTLFDKGDLEGYKNALDDIYNRLKNLKDTTIKNVVENLGLQDAGSKVANLDQIKKRLEDIAKIDFSGDSNVDTKFKEITTAVTEYETEVKRASQAGQNAFNNINVNKAVKDTRDLVVATDQYKNSVMSAKDQVQQLQQSTQYFFSLRNMINLLKRGISDAVQTVKELDAAMTETAVVTDFSVGDMWEKLPEYTVNANKLGATIQDMYESTTLYYQQGLNTQQSMAIATETMKMARIAGLEAKDATDMMTAALRGFNMELNEASAERINDVYSNLAAKTASDTEEIGKAMQRTASIAHSAGMSFEGTAAFLAQAVETTREPAENIGTAMKTIVARFQEMKKNPLEITEVDGEEVSYNKVDAALQSIGVSLKDTNGQFRELDKVFLDISKRWDGLSQTQQRYIATIAAGSRQQSRFIAMMGDYDRTVELMSYANDSAGASQEQFNKTLDSLEAKINKFRNAWDQFLMGIMNDSATKFVVDAGTKILDIINAIINKLSFNGEAGLLKSLLSIGTAFTALKAGGNIINKLIGGLGGLVDPTSSFGKGFWGAGKTTTEGTPTTGMAGKITTPIVAKLNELIAVTKTANKIKDINTNTNKQTTSTLAQYKNASAMLRNTKSLNMGDINTIFGGLSDEHAYAAYKNTPGTVDAMRKAALGWLSSKKMPVDAQKTGQQLMNAIFKGMSKKEISIKDGMELIGHPDKWGQQFGTDVAWNFSNTLSKELTSQANQKALENLGFTKEQAAGLGVGSDALKAWLTPKSQFTNDYIKEFTKAREELLAAENLNSLKEIPVVQTSYQQFANTIGNLGSRFSAAGMSIQQFGVQLGQLSPALEGVGALLTRVGSIVSTFGMGFSGISAVVNRFGTAMQLAKATRMGVHATGAEVASNFMTGLTAGLSPIALGAMAATAIVGGIIIAKGIADKKAREAGEEVRENFEKGFTETSEKIDTISDYKDRFNELSQGVDQFGHNINLTDEEFDEYLTISRELQELSPSLIKGYNAEGQAILRKGEALDEVIDKLKEERDLSLKDYITDDSIGKLIGEYNTSDAFKNHNTIKMGDAGMGDAFESEKSDISKAIKQVDLEWSDFSQILDELGIGGAASINDLTGRQLTLIAAHYTDIINKIKEFNPKIEEEAEDGLKEAFAGTSNAIEDVLTEGAPVIEALRQWMGQENLDAAGLELGEEFISGFNSGLDGIILEGLTNKWQPEDYKNALKEYAEEWKKLAGDTSDYTAILTEADEIQREYLSNIGKDGAVEDYKDKIEDSAQALEKLAAEQDLTTQSGQIFAEQCIEQANALRTYADELTFNLADAFNTMTNEIAEAEGALESFNKVVEGSNYSTASANMQKIYDEATSDTHAAGEGDQTFWAGAEALVGRKNLLENGKATKDSALKQMKEVQEMLKGGQEGWDNFKIKWFDSADAGLFKDLIGNGLKLDDNGWLKEIDENINPEIYDQIADKLNMSKDSLIAMLNLGRQFGEISFTNIDEVQKALETSEIAIRNTDTGKIFVRKEDLESEMTAAGVDLNKQQDIEEDLVTNHKVEYILDASEITKSNEQFTKMGIDSMETLVQTFDATGKFTKDEIAEYAKAYADINNIDNWETAFAEAWEQGQADEEFGSIPSSLVTIQSILASIESLIAGKDLSEGKLTKSTANDAKSWLYGEEGVLDTDAQKFWKGQGANGAITEAEFNKTSQELTDFIDRGTEYLGNLESAKQKALENQDYAELQKIEAERLAYVDMLKWANKFLTEGTEAYNNQNPQQTATDWKYGNVSKTNRPEGLIEDGKNVTVRGASSAFEIGDGKEIEIAYTPVVTLDGKGDILEDDTVQAYIETLIQQLQSEGKEVNLENLLELDSTGTIEGFEGIKNVIADVGDDAVITGIKMHALEAGLNVETIDAQYKSLSKTIEDVGKQADKAGQEGEKTTNGNLKSSTDVQATTYEVFTAGAEGDIDALSEKLQYLKDNYPEVHSELITEFPQYGELETYSEEIQKLDNKEVQQTVTASIANEGTLTGLSEGLTNLGKNNPEIKVSVDEGTSATQLKKLDKAANKLDDTKTLKVNVEKTGVKSITVDGHTWTISTNSGAKGINNAFVSSPLPSFGSAAKGRYGKLGPKGKGGLTLTGELGYEVAWIPSENRSMILGAGGPQMVNLPKDAVVWNHEQSKKIVKQQAIPAGSHYVESPGAEDPRGSNNKKSNKSKNKKKNKKKGSKKSKSKTKATINNFSVEEVVRFNIDQNLERLTNAIAKRTKDIEKSLEKIGTTYGDIVDSANAQISALQGVKNYNQQLLASYQRQLADYRSRSAVISYTNSKGKSKNKTINISDYLNADGTANTAAIAAAGGREVQEAIYKEINSAKSLVDGMNKAQKAIDDANDQIDEFNKKIADTFYNWENQITWVYNLTQRLNNIQSLRDRFSEQITLELNKVSAGFKSTAEAINTVTLATKRDNQALLDQINTQREMIKARKAEIENAYSIADEQNELAYQLEHNAAAGVIASARENLKAAELMREYISAFESREDGSIYYEIDWAKLEQNRRDLGITESSYNAIYKQLEKLNSATTDYNNSIKDSTSLMNQIYENLLDYQQVQVDLESDLLSGLEEQTEKEASHLKDLSSSISDALKDLLDEVKRKLDERRQQEDNAKTERDISQKQQRLAALRADTSGGHQVEIAQLEKEIAESQQSYQRTLEDQLLDRLQQQADEAAKQRERQIELLEIANTLGVDNRELVRKWVENPDLYQSQITEVLKTKENFGEAGFLRQEQILKEIDNRIVEAQNARNQLVEAKDTKSKQDELKTQQTYTAQLKAEKEQVDKDLTKAVELLARATDEKTANETSLAAINEKIQAKQENLQRVQHITHNLTYNEHYTHKYSLYTEKEKELQDEINRLNNQKQALTKKISQNDKAITDAQQTISDLQNNTNSLAEQINESIQKEKDLISQINQILNDTLIGTLKLAEEQKEILTDETYLNTHGDKVEGTYKNSEAEGSTRLTTAEEEYKKQTTTSTPAPAPAPAPVASTPTTPSNPYGAASATSGKIKKGASGTKVKSIQWALRQMGYKGSNGKALAIDGDFGDNTKYAVKAFQKDTGISQDGVVGDQTRKKFKAKGYKTGGLANYTGPAWLDGTPSKPELVLNAKDTQNFIALKDILSNVMKSAGSTSNSYGDVMYEININVDHLNNDYDVDKVVERVKKDIVKGAGYRNVTQVRNFR